MENKRLGYVILFSLLAYIFVVGYYGDSIASYASSQSNLIQLILYYATQTQFIIILIGAIYIGTKHGSFFGGLGAGFLIDLATDISSTPHCVLKTGFIQNAPNLNLCSDTIFIRWMDAVFPHAVSYSIYYYVIPIILVVLAFELMGVTQFTKYFEKKA